MEVCVNTMMTHYIVRLLLSPLKEKREETVGCPRSAGCARIEEHGGSSRP